ncbi:uncharacterized protein LOC124896172 [Capsicum annuum]|uniref:uncharacterized protein LOC124896172 n=1 Tax=Capsicum annuum TaxID=4072 RepID=UPI001FB099FC|nr:uncharacterized protein LOC124896172 [Capsicum annuum]
MDTGTIVVIACKFDERLSIGTLSHVDKDWRELVKDIHHLSNLGVCFLDSEYKGVFVQHVERSSLGSEIKEKYVSGSLLMNIKDDVGMKKLTSFEISGDGIFRYQWRLGVLNVDGLQGKILTEAHEQQNQCDSIWFIVDRMTKSAHFLPLRTTYFAEDYDKLFLQEVLKLHGVTFLIISDHGTQLSMPFWRFFQRGLGTKMSLSMDFHPQSDGQVERTIQNLED